jgi:hypothetical protein
MHRERKSEEEIVKWIGKMHNPPGHGETGVDIKKAASGQTGNRARQQQGRAGAVHVHELFPVHYYEGFS